MRFRKTLAELERAAERELEDQIRARVRPGGTPRPPQEFWSSLLVRTNQRIDGATSGRAITLSWAARVAIPGVVALLSFLVGLHYYAPLPQPAFTPLATVLQELPTQTVDSLLLASATVVDSADADVLNATMFEAGSEEIAEYLLESGTASEVSEFLDDDAVKQILQEMTRESQGTD